MYIATNNKVMFSEQSGLRASLLRVRREGQRLNCMYLLPAWGSGTAGVPRGPELPLLLQGQRFRQP